MPSYAHDMLDRIHRAVSDLEPDLAGLYAVLAMAKGAAVTVEDVHDARAIWLAITDPGHDVLAPFADLPVEEQDLYRRHQDGIHSAATAVA